MDAQVQLLRDLRVWTAADFVPQDKFDGPPSLNWSVRVWRGPAGDSEASRLVLETPYRQGYAHAPAYCQSLTPAVASECASGLVWGKYATRVPPPCAADVLYCILQDAAGSDAPFEEWASDRGLSADSRKAEAIWKQCRLVAASLRHAFTRDELDRLEAAFAEW